MKITGIIEESFYDKENYVTFVLDNGSIVEADLENPHLRRLTEYKGEKLVFTVGITGKMDNVEYV